MEISNLIDWEALAAQKHQLVKVVMNPAGFDPKLVSAAEGLLTFLDGVMDAGAEQGLPVVLLRPENEAELEAKLEAAPMGIVNRTFLLSWVDSLRDAVRAGALTQVQCWVDRRDARSYHMQGSISLKAE